MAANSGVSGKKVVYTLFALALLLALIVFRVGLNQKHKRLNNNGQPVPAENWKDQSKAFP